MNKLLDNLDFKVYTQNIIKANQENKDSKKRIIQGYASVGDVLDRQNEVITLGALVRAKNDLLENSTIFFNHAHNELPIGKTIAAEVDGNGLLITVEISQTADKVWTLIEEGTLDRFSIGGRVIQSEEKRDDHGNLFNEITKIELFETSVVGLPANPAAKFQVVSKSFSQAITEEMRKKGEENKMADDNKEVKKEEELEKEETTITEVSKDETPEVSKEEKPEIEKEETPEESEVTEEASEEIVEEVVLETKAEKKSRLLKELEDLEAEDSEETPEAEATGETSTEKSVEESSDELTEKSEEETEGVIETLEETSQEVAVEEKSIDEKILGTLDKIVQLLAKTEEKEEEKVEAEETTEEAEAEETEIAEVTEEVVAEETPEAEVVEEAVKSAEVSEEQLVEKKVVKVEKEVVEEEITRKGQANVIVAEAPYANEVEPQVDPKELEKLQKRARDLAWSRLLYGRK
jgi:HK97 family phage prohead protease